MDRKAHGRLHKVGPLLLENGYVHGRRPSQQTWILRNLEHLSVLARTHGILQIIRRRLERTARMVFTSGIGVHTPIYKHAKASIAPPLHWGIDLALGFGQVIWGRA